MSGIVVLLLALILIPVFLLLMFMPYVTRRTESFGVSIPESIYNDPQLKQMRKTYAIRTGVLSVIAIITFLILGFMYADNEQLIGIIFSAITLGYIILNFFIYLIHHKEMKGIKKDAAWARERNEHLVIDTAFRNQKHIYSNGWFLPSFLLIGATLFITFFQYDLFPDKIPMQYNFSGDVTNWVDKSIKSVLMMPFMQLFLLVLFLFINIMIGRSKQQISAENPEKSAKQSHIFRRRFSLFMIVNGTLLVLLFAIIQLSFMYPIDSKIIAIAAIGISALIVIGATILSFSTGQGGSRVQMKQENRDDVMDRDDDRYWKFGQIYVNKKDPALILEKRFGVGWTVNLAHPIVWVSLIGLIVVSAGIPILLSM